MGNMRRVEMNRSLAADPELRQSPDASSLFATEHLKTDLKRRSLRGGATTVLGQGMKFTIQLVSTAVLARLLTPEHFGLIGMVTAVTGFATLFKDLGLSAATIQRADISHQQISTLFWVNCGIGILVAAIVAALSPVVAWFYGDPRLAPITATLALSFVFGGLTVQHEALLRRQMRFGTLVCIEILAMSGGVTARDRSGGSWGQILVPGDDEYRRSTLHCRWGLDRLPLAAGSA